MFVAHRQFASASGLEEIDVEIALPEGFETSLDRVTIYPATVWDGDTLVVLRGYYASIDGTVWSWRRGFLKRITKTKAGQVCLYVDGGRRTYSAHRIMASTFLSDIKHPGQTEVDHIDIKRSNGALSNLRWATKKQNAANKCPVKAKAHRKRTSDLLSKPVQQLCPETGAVITEFPSAVAAAKAIGTCQSQISAVTAKRRKAVGGFAWRLAPRKVTLEDFKARGPEVVGGTLEEAPHLWFSADLKVYNDGRLGKMYEIPTNQDHQYPIINIGGSSRPVHVVVAVLRSGKYSSLAEYDDYCARRLRDEGVTVVVMHDDDKNRNDWWNCTIGTASENSQDALRNGCNTGKTAARPVTIRLGPDPTADILKYDTHSDNGMRMATFPSYAEAARALETYTDLKHLSSNIARSVRAGCSFSLKNGVKAWAFAA